MTNKTLKIFKMLFGIYCIVMLYLLFGQRIGWASFENYFEHISLSYNIIPFKTIRDFMDNIYSQTINPYYIRHAIINLIGNVVMFVPLGFFLPSLWAKLQKFWKFILCIIGIILAIEIIQLVTLLGSLDIDDLILNTLGAIVGFIIYKISVKLIAKHKKSI